MQSLCQSYADRSKDDFRDIALVYLGSEKNLDTSPFHSGTPYDDVDIRCVIDPVGFFNDRGGKLQLNLTGISIADDRDLLCAAIQQQVYSRFFVLTTESDPFNRDESLGGHLTGLFTVEEIVKLCLEKSLPVPRITLCVPDALFSSLKDTIDRFIRRHGLENAKIQFATFKQIYNDPDQLLAE